MGKIIHSFEAVGCVDVWLQAMDYLVEHKIGCNIVLGVEKPVSLSPIDYRIQGSVNEFLIRHEALPISTVATTIFPGAEFLHGGAHEVYEEFPKTFNTIREGWGTYAMRLLTKSTRSSKKPGRATANTEKARALAKRVEGSPILYSNYR